MRMQCDSDEYSLLYFSFLAGRLRAGSVLWTEDWFGDDKASEWSYLGSRLRSAARLGGVRSGAKGGDDNAVGWGGYIVPRGPTSGVARGGLYRVCRHFCCVRQIYLFSSHTRCCCCCCMVATSSYVKIMFYERCLAPWLL